jgi:hypothetical protein
MTNFPISIDDDTTLPRVDGNITEVGDEAINATRSAIFAIESNIGIGAAGTLASIADRLTVSLNNDGSIKPSSLLGIGLVALPITNSQISSTAAINESKLALTYSTGSLYSLYVALKSSVDAVSSFVSVTGVKLQPHLDGTENRHKLSHIDVETGTVLLKTNPTVGSASAGTNVINRNKTNLETLAVDISNDLTIHEKADGTASITINTGGAVPPKNFAHNASGIYVNTNNFSSIPQSNTDLQKIANFIDNSSLLLLGSRTPSLANGISRTSRSTPLLKDGYGSALVPPTPVTAYHLNVPPGPISSVPLDDIDHGDDVILFNPTTSQLNGFVFDAQFAQVRPGDLITVNYGTGISYQFVIESVRDVISGPTRTFAVRINGRNPFGSSAAYAQIDRALFNRNKQNALSNIRVPNSTGVYETLLVSSPRGAMTLGINFNPTQIGPAHYKLYLSLLQNGDFSSTLVLPGVDITGNKGTTPGKYTLSGLVNSTNEGFRSAGFNYRLVAFEYNGQFGVAMADHYHNTGFSVVAGNVDSNGLYTSTSNAVFTKNVIDNYNGIDPIGFGALGSNVGSPPPTSSHASALSAQKAPTIVFSPLKRNFYYVNGVERDTLNSDPLNLTGVADQFGDGYWPAVILPAPATQILSNRVETAYQVSLDVSQSSLSAGKTIVVQPNIATSDTSFNLRDYGRYTVKSVSYFNCGTMDGYANITVYDSVHAAGTSPAPTSTNIQVNIYFSDDSVAFNKQNIADTSVLGQFKRHFESYVDKAGHTFTHERARFIILGNIGNINFFNISPKLRGYDNGLYREIRLKINNYDNATGIFDGNLARWNSGPSTYSNVGPTITGKKGEVVRFYDETHIDYIDFIFDLNDTVSSFTNGIIDVQLFSSLALNEEQMLLSTCQMDDNSKKITHLQDKREFGNVSEQQLTKSAADYITAVTRAILKNRVIAGFDNYSLVGNTISINGGSTIIDGKVVLTNNSTTTIPLVQEILAPGFTTAISTINWVMCLNRNGQIELIADTTSGTANRIFYVIDPTQTTPVPYAIRSAALASIISSYNDLTPLYALTANTTGSGTSWTFSSITNTDQRIFIAKI